VCGADQLEVPTVYLSCLYFLSPDYNSARTFSPVSSEISRMVIRVAKAARATRA
jgi:hypothetical protein